jgi:hypothetical protein
VVCVAVFALRGADATSTFDAERTERAQLYAGSFQALYLVNECCKAHVSAAASDALPTPSGIS